MGDGKVIIFADSAEDREFVSQSDQNKNKKNGKIKD
jgi:hypothetical protein